MSPVDRRALYRKALGLPEQQLVVASDGTFVYLDGGTLDLGLVRDSQVNAVSDYQIFGEVFENVASMGQGSTFTVRSGTSEETA